jgi:putative transcriptional regulator
MPREYPSAGNMTGSLLVAHPSLRDSHFSRTILFLSHHSSEDGAIGLVLNRPLRKVMGDIAKTNAGNLRRVPVFYGGPVAQDALLLASVQWIESPNAVAFRGFGDPSDDVAIPPELQPTLRAFSGYSGWSRGQLESEIAQKSWLLVPPTRDLIELPHPEHAWRDLMRQLGPVYKLLAEMPDDPSLN